MNSRMSLESATKERNSRVSEIHNSLGGILSTAGHEKPRGNPGGPPSKAKYSIATDSELVP